MEAGGGRGRGRGRGVTGNDGVERAVLRRPHVHPEGPGVLQPQSGALQSQSGALQSQSVVLQAQSGVISPQSAVILPQSVVLSTQSGTLPPQSVVLSTQSGTLPPQPGVLSPQSGVLSQSGIILHQPGFPPPQPGLNSHQPGVLPPQPGVLPPQPGVLPPQPGVLAPQPGVFSPQPGVFPPQPGVFPQQKQNSTIVTGGGNRNWCTSSMQPQEIKSKKTFLLSADAPEFVPRTFIQPSAQPQIQISNPVQSMQQHHQVTSPVVPQPQIQYTCHPVVVQVNNLVVQLTIKPNRFDQIARQLTTILTWQVKDAYLMKELITVIFEQGVGEVNFRYSGAKLCQHLSKNVTQSYNGPTFKSVLLQRCQEEFNVKDVYLHTDPPRVCGFTLFLAELFTQLVTSSGETLNILQGALCQLLRALLSHPTDSNLKCVAQVLKFTGSNLDSSNRNEMDQLMCNLKDVAMTAPVSTGTRSLLLAVIELRAANWGRGPPSPPHSPGDTPTHSNIPMGTVYYGPGGVIQRVEDEPEDSASDTDDFINSGWSPAVEELEGDVAEAFEEFLRLQQ